MQNKHVIYMLLHLIIIAVLLVEIQSGYTRCH